MYYEVHVKRSSMRAAWKEYSISMESETLD